MSDGDDAPVGAGAVVPALPAISGAPAPPALPAFGPKDKYGILVGRVRDALRVLPSYFESETHIDGIEAGDLFSLNSVLGGALEIQVVETLNKIRSLWDPADEWAAYRFERQSQTFPDVRLIARTENGVDAALGIELKGWYVLSKERVPSFRYIVTPDACAAYDLLVIVPWHLKNVLSGSPVTLEPFIISARYAAEYRNYWWQFVRESKGNKNVNRPAGTITPYPNSKTDANDSAASDKGKNFGRIARIGDLIDTYTKTMLTERIAGIEARAWIEFFKLNTDASDPEAVWRHLEKRTQKRLKKRSEHDAERLFALLDEMAAIVRGEPGGDEFAREASPGSGGEPPA